MPSRPSDTKKKAGRPRTGTGVLIGLRWHEDDIAAIEAWRGQQPNLPSRSVAIRQLVKLGLSVGAPSALGLAMVPLAAHPKPGRRGRAGAVDVRPKHPRWRDSKSTKSVIHRQPMKNGDTVKVG